jgi:mRNA interferase MazF
VVNVTQVFTVNKSDCIEKIGSLSKKRLDEVLAGFNLGLTPRDIED